MRATAAETAARAALRRVWPDPSTIETAEIRAIGGGVHPRTFLAVAGRRRCVLRLPISGSMALLDLPTEARAMRTAAATGLAPAVVAVDAEAGILLTELGTNPYHFAERVRQPIVIAQIARLLKALHALPIELPVIYVERIAARYRTEIAGGERPITAAERDWADELERLAGYYDASYAPTAFCHNDLVASNILANGAAAQLIDFEYAGRAAPLLDLANLAAMNDFAAPQRRLVLSEYYGESVEASTARELDNAIRMVRLLAYFWARVAQQRMPGTDAYARLIADLGATLK
jgi:Ser/Thr protein kinase RdoA (MazF antagonist)